METWSAFLKYREAISGVIVQKAVSGLCLSGITNCFLKIGKKTTGDDIERIMLYQL